MKTVLITGGAGFIGSHLTDAYLKLGWNVIALDDLSTGRLENLENAKSHRGFELIEGDVRDDDLVLPAVKRSDLVVHLAARIGLKLIVKSPLKTLLSNGKGTETILEHAGAQGVPIILASTSEVYGLAVKYPSSEDDPVTFGAPTVGRWSYACSKAYDEALTLAYHHECGLPAVVVRFFNTVGPRQSGRYGMVLPRFVSQALTGTALTVYGDGTQTRSFGHVSDAVNALIRLAQEPRAIGNVFNIGNPSEIAIRDLAQRIITLTGSSSRLEYVPFEQAYGDGFEEIMRRVPDISKAKELIDFRPRASLDDVLNDVIAEQRAMLTASVR